METILQTKKVTKTYQTNDISFQALHGVDLTVKRGEFVAVMGASGSGKSTLLHLLGGLDSPSKGEVWVAGQRIDNLSEAKRAILRRKLVGFVFQRFNLIGNLTVADNIELPALLAGMSPREAEERRQALLSDLGISDKGSALPNQLSGGQQQRVALARALINEPAVLLADEPTGNLDSTSTNEVLALIDQFHQRGQTILLVTHDTRVGSMADRVITMRDGEISTDSPLNNGQTPPVLAQLIEMEA